VKRRYRRKDIVGLLQKMFAQGQILLLLIGLLW
jgi:hypothetical protein